MKFQHADEDYETDNDILRRTIHVCKKDVLKALNYCKENPQWAKSLRNHKFQRYYRLEEEKGKE